MSKPDAGRSYIPLLVSHYEAIKQMPRNEGNEFLRAIADYGFLGIEPNFTGLMGILWTAIFPILENNRILSLSGSRGGKVSKRNNPNGRRGKATAADPETSDGSELEKTNSRKPQRKTAPTLDNIRGYIEMHKLNVDAEEFYNCYSSQNWEIDGNPIRSIAALLKRWSERANGEPTAERPARFTPNERGEVDVCGIIVKLGYGERINSNGQRTYGNGEIIVPQDAPRRPADGYEWSETLNKWVYNSF